MTDQGELEYYLGVEVSKVDESTLLLHQTGYAKRILERLKMSECKEVKTPLPRDLNLSLMDSPDEVDPILQSEYRTIIGSLSVDTSRLGIRSNVSVKVSSQTW